jgi:glycosyltransferase involved in cell wall biosynthesis
MKIAFAGRWNPEDKKAWSGTYYSTYRQIKKHYEVQPFYYKWPFYVREYLLLHKQFQNLQGKKAAVEFLKGYAKYFSKQLEKDLLKHKVDVIFSPGATQLLAYCNTSVPIVYLTDATFQQLQQYYSSFADIAAYNIKQGIELDKKTFTKAAHCMLASDWAKQSAVNDYGIAASKITVAPLGPNIDVLPAENEIAKIKTNTCHLLFVGVEWERKGGQIAVDTYNELKKNNFAATLTIIGCMPPYPIKDNGITVIPFLNRSITDEANRLAAIFKQSHFLLLPTRAECAGVVFCEAAAYGMPSITTDTGGVPTYVKNNVTGVTLTLSATGSDYAEKIMHIYRDENIYQQLCAYSRSYYNETLNWDAWGESFKNIVNSL